MEKITTYTAMGGKLEKELFDIEELTESYVSLAMGIDWKEATAFIQKSESEGKHFIFVYPAFGEVDTSAWEFIGEIMDGGLYLGIVK